MGHEALQGNAKVVALPRSPSRRVQRLVGLGSLRLQRGLGEREKE